MQSKRRKVLRIWGIFGAASCLLIASCSSLGELTAPTVSTAPNSTTSHPGDEPSPVLAGIAVPSNNPALLKAAEDELGVTFGVVRVFARWDTGFPDGEHLEIMNSGHRLHLSVRPRTDSRDVVMWRDMAAAEPGSSIYSEMEAWADRAIQMPPGSYFTLNHEPETRDSAGNGEAAEFVAAWQAFTTIMRERGGDHIKMTWVMTGGAFSDDRANQWYPGDEWVDVVGVDPYNWYLCQGTERDWRSFETLVNPALDFAEAHDKPLVVPEFASAEDKNDPARKAAWMRDAALTLATPRYEAGIEFVAWFNVHDSGYPDCDWNYDSSSESTEAFADLMSSLTQAAG